MTDTNPTHAEPYADIERRAADFLLRRRVARWSEADQVELNAWLDESSLHRVAYLRLVAGEAVIAKLQELRGPAPRRLAIARHVRSVMPFLASAAALSFVLGAVLFAAPYLFRPADRSYATEVGGRALLSFADNTQIELNTDTAVRYRMTTAERTVWLDRGEAWFHVAHDAAKPFHVIAGHQRITDLGTDFLVRKTSGDVEVALIKGRAALAGDSGKGATLAPGDEAVATQASLSVTHKTPQELEDALAWRRGIIVFRNTRLADAVREFNRYNATKLVVADPAVADLKFSAQIRTENYEDFVHIAQTVLNLSVDREGNEILISRVAARAKRLGAAGVR